MTEHGADLAVFVATSGHSGVDRVIKNLLPGFAAEGLRVDLLSIRKHGPYIDRLPEGVRRVPLDAAHVSTSLPGLAAYLRRIKPTVLLTDKDKVNRAALFARWLAGAPTRLAFRTGTTLSVDLASRRGLDGWIQRKSVRHLYRHADVLLTPSRGAADDLARLAGLPAESVIDVPSPVVSPAMLEAASAPVDHPWLQPQATTPVIIGVGELGGRKDFATLIEAFALLRQRQAARLIIFGRGKRRDALLAQTEQLGVAGDVDLPGFVDNPYAYMAKASLFALSSLWEGSPVVLMEALALGLPIVATDCPSGPAEVLEKGALGALVPVGDAQAMADAMAAMLASPPDPARLREASERYSVSNSARAYLRAMGLLRDAGGAA